MPELRQHQKLVRDRLRFLPAPKDSRMLNAEFRLCEPGDYGLLLINKMDEEVEELKRAINDGDIDALSEEIADLREVLTTMAEEFADVSEETIVSLQRIKRASKGGFKAGVVLIWDERITPKPAIFMLNERHTTHVTKSQARRERQAYRAANKAVKERLKKRRK